MSGDAAMGRTNGASLQLKARMAGALWLLVFVAGSVALAVRSGPVFIAANIVAPVCYAVVTLLLYGVLKPVSGILSLLAAAIGLAGCAVSLLHLAPIIHLRDLVLFGFYCGLLGYLIVRSTFLPRILGVLLMFAGLGWLTFLSPSFARQLSPYNLMPGMLGEGLFSLWLLLKGVNVQRWMEQGGAVPGASGRRTAVTERP